jgi:metal-sulfur cluster biosynthetic enzyme
MGETLGPQLGATLLAKLQAVLEKIETLRVTTVIGTVTNGQIGEDEKGLKVTFTATPTDTACTTIDMVLGDITSVRSQAFTDANYAKLHEDNLAFARAVRGETMEILTKGLAAVEAFFKK